MSTDGGLPIDQHPLHAIIRQLDKARDLVVRAYEEREAVLTEGDTRRADLLIKAHLLRLNEERDAVTLSRLLREAFDHAVRRHRIEVINTDLSGQVELAAKLVEDLRDARRSQDLEKIDEAEYLLQERLDAIYDILDDGSRQVERQVHDNAGTQVDSAQRRRMNEFYHSRLTKLTEEYQLVKTQLQEAPFDTDAWLIQRVVDLLMRTNPILERISLANREITAYLHKDRQREQRALKIRAVLARVHADPGFFPAKAAANASEIPGIFRIGGLTPTAAPDLGPNADTRLFAEDVAKLAARLGNDRPALQKSGSTLAKGRNATKTLPPPEGQALFDVAIEQTLATGCPVSARAFWTAQPADAAPAGWSVATFLYALNTHIIAGAVTATGRQMEDDIGRMLITRAAHPLSGTQSLHDLVIYPITLPTDLIPEAVHYDRMPCHAE